MATPQPRTEARRLPQLAPRGGARNRTPSPASQGQPSRGSSPARGLLRPGGRPPEPEVMTKWTLPEITKRGNVSLRPFLRSIIEDKLTLARTSAPHAQHLAQYTGEIVAERAVEARRRATKIHRMMRQQLHDSVPERRVERFHANGVVRDAAVSRVRNRRDDLAQEFLDNTESALQRQKEKHDEGIRQSQQRHWLLSIAASLFAVRLAHRAAGSSDPSKYCAEDGPIPAPAKLRRRLVEGRSTLERYIVEYQLRQRRMKVRLWLLRFVAYALPFLRRAKLRVALRHVRYTLDSVRGAGCVFVGMRRFRFQVTSSQRLVRSFLACGDARRQLLRRQIERVWVKLWQPTGKLAKGEKKRKTVRPRPMESNDVESLVADHLLQIRRANGRLRGRFSQDKQTYVEMRQRTYWKLVREREEAGLPPLSSEFSDWDDIDAAVTARMGTTVVAPTAPKLTHLAPVDVLAAQLRGCAAACQPIEGVPNPTSDMLVVSDSEQAALDAWVAERHNMTVAHAVTPTNKASKKSKRVKIERPADLPDMFRM